MHTTAVHWDWVEGMIAMPRLLHVHAKGHNTATNGVRQRRRKSYFFIVSLNPHTLSSQKMLTKRITPIQHHLIVLSLSQLLHMQKRKKGFTD
jgi:hypothetical protein